MQILKEKKLIKQYEEVLVIKLNKTEAEALKATLHYYVGKKAGTYCMYDKFEQALEEFTSTS